jgi:hypothetical protein
MIELTPGAYENLVQQISGLGELLQPGAEPERLLAAQEDLERAAWRLQVASVKPLEKKIQTLVSELASRLKKRVELTLDGFDLELEPRLRDAVFNFFLHAIRNSLDHGIEAPEQRQKLSKPEQGALRVRLALENARVVIEVADDGRGVDVDLLAKRLEDRGLRASEDALKDPLQLFELLARAGSSRSHQPTQTSGRGVGLSSIRTALKDWNPQAHLSTEIARGTELKLTLEATPLALDVLPLFFRDRIFWIREPLAEAPLLAELGAEVKGASHWVVFQAIDPSWKRLGPKPVREWLELHGGRALAARPPRALARDDGGEFAFLLEDPEWLSSL